MAWQVRLLDMQAVILAAGRGSRMGALTDSMPKPLLEVNGKSLLEYKFDSLPYDVDEVIIIVGYQGHLIQQRFGGEHKGKRVLYVEQENPKGGTAEAVWKAESILKDKFLVMNGDNIYATEDLSKCAVFDWAVLVQKRDHIGTGRVIVNEGGLVTGIVENSAHEGQAGYANTGCYMLDRRFFNYKPIPKAEGSTELGLPQTMMQAVNDIQIQAVEARMWIEIKSAEDLLKAEALLK